MLMTPIIMTPATSPGWQRRVTGMTARSRWQCWRPRSRWGRPLFRYYRESRYAYLGLRHGVWLSPGLAHLTEHRLANLLEADRVVDHWLLTLLQVVWNARRRRLGRERFSDPQLYRLIDQCGRDQRPGGGWSNPDGRVEFDLMNGTYMHVPLYLGGA